MQSEKKEERNPALLVILAEGFSSRLSFGVIGFVLPLFAYRKLGLSLTETGFLFSLNLIAEQLFKPLMGWIAGRIGLKRAFSAAIALRSLVALFFVFATSPWQVYGIRVLHGLSESLRDPSVNALIAENARKKSIASAYAWYTTAKISAGSVGRALGGFLLALTFDNYSNVFLVAFTLSILPLFVVIRFLPDNKASSFGEEEQQPGENQEGASTIKRVLPIALLGFLVAGTAQMMSNLFPLLAMEYGHLSAAAASTIYLISILMVIGAGPLFGWLSDHVSHKFVLLIRGITNTFSSVVIYFFPGYPGLAAGSVADAMGKAAFRPAWGALMAQASEFDSKRRVRTMSYLSLGEGLGETIGPLLGGFLWHNWGVGAMLGARVLMALVAEGYALFVIRDNR
ncbi:MAG: MFS transporter [Acidobacteria bacterium]|nr:MFS transporter [Acidobacteriota bacterium]